MSTRSAFQLSPKYWNRNLYVQNVLVDLESCVGMFCCLTLSPKRPQGTLPLHYTYSDWLNCVLTCSRWAEVFRSCKITPATLEPHVLDALYTSRYNQYRYTGTSFNLSSIVMKRDYVLPVHRYQGTLVLRYLVSGTVLIFIKPTFSSLDSI